MVSKSIIISSTSHPVKNNTLMNPFEARLLGGNEAQIRSLHMAIRDAGYRVQFEKPSIVLFSNSSGFPLFKAYVALSQPKEASLPPVFLLPLSSHNFHEGSREKIYGNQKEIRANTYAAEAARLKKGIEFSQNPEGPIYLIDEVLSGASVVGIRRALEKSLRKAGMENRVHVVAIASQEHMLFQGSLPEMIYPLVEKGQAFMHPQVVEQMNKHIRYNDFQLTGAGLEALFAQDAVKFKNSGFEALIRAGVADVIPVIRLFTTDNLAYNPLLVLNEKGMRLEATPISYNHGVQKNTSKLMDNIISVEFYYQNKNCSLHPRDYFLPQPLPSRLRQ